MAQTASFVLRARLLGSLYEAQLVGFLFLGHPRKGPQLRIPNTFTILLLYPSLGSPLSPSKGLQNARGDATLETIGLRLLAKLPIFPCMAFEELWSEAGQGSPAL